MRYIQEAQHQGPAPARTHHYFGWVNSTFLRYRRLCLLAVLLCGAATVVGDDTRETAVSIAVNSSADGEISPVGDSDYWRIEVPSRGHLVVETSGGVDMEGELQDSAGGGLIENDDGGLDNNFRIVLLVDAGTYYVQVREYYVEATGPYTLHVCHIPSTGSSDAPVGICRDGIFTGDSDDSLETATPIALNSSANGVISNAWLGIIFTERDVWSIEVPSPGILVVETSGDRTRTEGNLLDSHGNEISSSFSGGADFNFRIVQRVDAGTYYVRVNGTTLVEGETDGPYTLHVCFISAGGGGGTSGIDARMGNCRGSSVTNRSCIKIDSDNDDHGDELSNATALTFNKRVTGSSNIFRASAGGAHEVACDVDYFSLQLSRPQQLWVYYKTRTVRIDRDPTLVHEPPFLLGSVLLQDSSGSTLVYDESVYDENAILVEKYLLGPGTYYLRVEGGSLPYFVTYGYHLIYTEPSSTPTETYRSLGDLNGDGNDDVLLRNEDRALVLLSYGRPAPYRQ